MAHTAATVLGHRVTAERIDPAEWARGPGARLSQSARDDLLAMFAAYDRRGSSAARLPCASCSAAPRTWADALRADDAVSASALGNI